MVHPIPPNPALAPFIQCFLALSHDFDAQLMERTFSARGVPMLVFPFSKPSFTGFRHMGEVGTAYQRPLMDTPALLQASTAPGICHFMGEVNFIMVMLKPTGAYHFLREGVQGSSNSILPLADLDLSTHFEELQERLWQVSGVSDAVALAQAYLLRHFQKSELGKPGDFMPVMGWLMRNPGRITVRDVAKKFKCSERWIEKQCAVQTGLPPKTWLRLIRYRAAANYWLQKPGSSSMALVANFNYTDQSHLIRDFKQFSGNPPVQHFALEKDTELGFQQNSAGLGGLISPPS